MYHRVRHKAAQAHIRASTPRASGFVDLASPSPKIRVPTNCSNFGNTQRDAMKRAVSITVNGRAGVARSSRGCCSFISSATRRADRHEGRLRHEPVRLVHGAARRRRRQVVHVSRRAGRRRVGHDDRRARAGRQLQYAAGSVLGEARPAVRLLHAGDDVRGARAAADESAIRQPEQIRHALEGNMCRCTGYQNIVRVGARAAARCGRRGDERHRDDRHACSAPASGAAKIRG